ncbi:ABC transporter permease subunit [Vibrio rumoiensis]
MTSFTDWDILRNLLLAARWTLLLSLLAFLFGGLLGAVLTFIRSLKRPMFNWIINIYVEIFQGTPLLMQMFLAFFGLSLIGMEVSAWTAAILSLTLFSAAFFHDIWRGCI